MRNLKSFVSLCLALFILNFKITSAQQPFNLTFGGNGIDATLSCTITADNSYIIGGHTYSFQVDSSDLYLVKINEAGNIVWNKTYGNFGIDGIREIKKTNDNGYILGGYSGSGIYWDFLVMKVDSLGNPAWAKSIGGFYPDECLAVSQTKDNGYIAAGHTKSYGSYPSGYYADFYLIKYSSSGEVVWKKVFGWDYHDWAHYVTQTKDNGYAVLGYSDLGNYYVDYDITLVKTDSVGNIIWTKAYALNGDEYAFEFKETEDGEFVIAGYTKTQNIFLIKTTSEGTVRWAKQFMGVQDCYAYSLNSCSDGGFIIGGQVGSTNSDAILIRTDSDGNIKWARKYAGNGSESFSDVKEIANKEFLASGNTNSIGDYSVNILIIKTDSIGQSVCPSNTINLSAQQFSPTAYQFFNFHTLSGGDPYDWNYTVKNPTPTIYSSCIVPVELLLFDYFINKNNVELCWSTATELNNQRFEIYRNDMLVGFKEGHGTTITRHDYSFSDTPPQTGKYIYKIVQIDYDGSKNEVGKVEIFFNQIPIKYELSQNYPNPFNPATTINFALPQTSEVVLKVYDLLGREMETLVNEEKEAGYHEVVFDGSRFSSGTYIYTLRTNNFSESKKLLLIK